MSVTGVRNVPTLDVMSATVPTNRSPAGRGGTSSAGSMVMTVGSLAAPGGIETVSPARCGWSGGTTTSPPVAGSIVALIAQTTRLYRRGTTDGVATAVLGLFIARDPEVRWEAIANLLDEIYADERWVQGVNRVEVAREAIERHPEVVDKGAWCAPISVAAWAGAEAVNRGPGGYQGSRNREPNVPIFTHIRWSSSTPPMGSPRNKDLPRRCRGGNS
jgi:hypothetical protein